ncbi:uncharacterized protein LOC115723739 [Cannabis sativa]|uniref:uncharacterized protein LOC115723739 n=1 Tax=Cannabis sativa TaxID=3483 RepID=UPI0011DFE77C|nr:uncharacterized protein LOC115723739 [Cannabis sativa]
MEECENAFQELKRQPAKPLVLSKPLDGEELGIYLAVTEHVVSVVLIREENNIQHTVYYISKRLVEAERRYPLIEKLPYCLILATRKLRPFFQAHPNRVYTDQPLRQVLQKPDASGQLLKWVVELGQYEIFFQPRTTIKGQALIDFVVECTGKDESISKNNLEPVQEPQPSNNEDKPTWKLHVDWSEYEALIVDMKLAWELHAEHIEICSDSQLVVNHVSGEYKARGEKKIAYLSKIHYLLAQFKSYVLKKILRDENTTADTLARLASSNITDKAKLLPIEFLEKPSITCSEEIRMIDTSLNWMTPIAAYLNTEELPSNRNEAQKMMRKAARYIILDGVMYRRGFSMSLLRCVTEEEAAQLLSDVLDGFCGNHAAGQSLSKKILRQGYFWPTIIEDSKAYVKKCDKFQRFLKIPCALPNEITLMQSPWHFAIWGIDLIEKFPKGKGGVQYAVVAVDCFTKWTEAKPLATIKSKKVQDFMGKNIICRFKIPYKIVSDNGKQFDSQSFTHFCANHGIMKSLSAVAYP